MPKNYTSLQSARKLICLDTPGVMWGHHLLAEQPLCSGVPGHTRMVSPLICTHIHPPGLNCWSSCQSSVSPIAQTPNVEPFLGDGKQTKYYHRCMGLCQGPGTVSSSQRSGCISCFRRNLFKSVQKWTGVFLVFFLLNPAPSEVHDLRGH